MRILSITRIFLTFSLLAGVFSCTEKKEELEFESLDSYLPLQKGKYVTYRIDSLVTTPFNLSMTVHSYLVKHEVDAQITDAQGRPSFRIYKYLNNEFGTDQWTPNGSYMITPVDKQIEVVEDNLRVIKLHEPLRDGYTWKGNAYIPNEAYQSFGYNVTGDNNMQNWDFTYPAKDGSFTFNGKTYQDVYTVNQQINHHNLTTDFLNIVPKVDTIFASRTVSIDKYAKNIGLVYRQFHLWEYQPNPTFVTDPITLEVKVVYAPTYTGFGVTMWMVDHN